MHNAEYSLAQVIYHEPSFNWRVRHTPKKHDRIVSIFQKLQTRYLKKTHKFGIELPKTVSEAHELDQKNSNTLWADEISKEKNNLNIAFDIMPDGYRVPNGCKQIRCHMIFDIKMEEFRCKAGLVADVHMAKNPKCQTYYSFVSRETLRLACNIAVFNYLQVKAGDVMNAYVTAPVTKKVWTILGNE